MRNPGLPPPDPTPLERRICGDILDLGVPVQDRGFDLSVQERADVTCSVDTDHGTFCLQGVLGSEAVVLLIKDRRTERQYSYLLETSKYLDGSRRLTIDLNKIEASAVTPGEEENHTGEDGRPPIPGPNK